jgi:guanylate kinase
MRNVLLVLSGPSGVGKGTISEILKKSDDMSFSISYTTRQPRAGEEHGKHYFFVSKEEFLNGIENDEFLEYSNHFDNYYGTPKSFVLDKLKNTNVLLEIDVNGALMVKKSFPDAVLVMIVPPSREELKARLINRGTESLQKIEERISRMDYELEKQSLYDYTVINDDLDKAVLEIKNIILKEKSK